MEQDPAPSPTIKAMVAAALAKPVLLHDWPAPLQQAWAEKRHPEMLQDAAFVLKLGFVLALSTIITDLLIAPMVAWAVLGLRIALIGPITLLGFLAIRHGKLAYAQLAMILGVSIFGATAMWVAAHGSEADLARYSMAIVITMLVGMLILPMTLGQKLRAAAIFFLSSLIAALVPPGLPPEAIIHHCGAAIIAAIAGYLLSLRGWQLEARTFLLGLQQGFDRTELEESNALLRELSESDPLTGLPNRRSLEREFEAHYATRVAGATALMMIDIDHFKQFNDRYGHQAGDRCLVEVARELERCIARHGGHVARFGGEEFVALLHEEGGCDAMQVAETLRETLSRLAIPTGQKEDCSVTASFGVVRTQRAQPIGQLIARADEALYRAKQNGRNRVEPAYAAMEDLPG